MNYWVKTKNDVATGIKEIKVVKLFHVQFHVDKPKVIDKMNGVS